MCKERIECGRFESEAGTDLETFTQVDMPRPATCPDSSDSAKGAVTPDYMLRRRLKRRQLPRCVQLRRHAALLAAERIFVLSHLWLLRSPGTLWGSRQYSALQQVVLSTFLILQDRFRDTSPTAVRSIWGMGNNPKIGLFGASHPSVHGAKVDKLQDTAQSREKLF